MYRTSARSLFAGRALAVFAALAGLAVLVFVLPVGASAQVSQPLTVEQVRASFAGAGFQVEPAISWTWTSPPVTTLQIFDRASGRVLMALVYPDAVAAQTDRLQAQAHELPAPVLDEYGPHLVPGYGQSLWRGNVALVQTTQSELDGVFQFQNERDNRAMVDTTIILEPGPPSYVVDPDFQQALDRSIVNL